MRLFSLLDRCRPICWVSGPPGAGKTTLVASYVEAHRLRPLWYQLDEGDGDVATLFYYLRQAAVHASPRKRWGLPLLTPEYLAGLGTFARRWFEELFAGLPKPFVLVFDNYQTVAAESPLHDVLRSILENLSAGNRAVIISRADPPSSLARLRAESRIALIDWTALRLTRLETAGIARARTARAIPKARAQALHATTDGWAAGVVLMLERAMGSQADGTGDAKPRQAVFDYFASEILARSDVESRQILMETALLPKVTARHAEALTSSRRAGEVLADLADRRYFTDCHPEPEPTYQYHPLFREFLLARGRAEIGEERRRELRRMAASLLEQSGALGEAADLLCEAEDWQGIARLVVDHGGKLVGHGRGATLERWLGFLPRHLVEDSPWLLYWFGVCRLPFAPKDSTARARQAFDQFTARGEPNGAVAAASLAIDAILCDWADFNALDAWIESVESLLTDSARPLPQSLQEEAAVSLLAALNWRAPDHHAIAACVRFAEKALHTSRNPALRVRSAFVLAWYFMWRGEVAKSQVMLDTLKAIISSERTALLPRLWNASVEADLAWIRADIATCRDLVARALELATNGGVRIMDLILITARTIGELVAHDLVAARQSLNELRSIEDAQPVRVAQYHYLAGWAALLEGDLSAAHAHAEAGERLILETGAYFAILVLRHAVAQTLFERNEREAARIRLAEAMRMARAMCSYHVEYMCLITESDFAFRENRPEAGLESVRQAFALGREYGILSGAWWRRDVVARLCARALEAGVEVDYARRVVQVHRLVAPSDVTAPAAWPWHVCIRALGRFEMEIEDQSAPFIGRAQRKPLELLKALVAFGGRAVTERQIADALWPDADGDLAQQSLAVTLHRLRKLLGSDEAVRRHEGQLDLDPQHVWTDVGALHASLENAALAGPRERTRLIDRMLKLYRGPLLAGEEESWIGAPRARLRARFTRKLDELARAAEERGETDSAVQCYLKALEADEGAEELYRGLMALYSRLGRRAEMLALYQRCRTSLQAALGVVPSSETEALASSSNRT